MTENDGGPAFPASRWEKRSQKQADGAFRDVDVKVDSPGMSLRDWFAGQALTNRYTQEDNRGNVPTDFYDIADWAYCIADALLAARAKGGGK